MEAILEKLLQSPKLSLYVEQLQVALADEKNRRRAFYDWVTNDQKAEFINGEIVVHSPVMKRHNAATGLLYKLASTYVALHATGFVGFEKIMISLTRNDYEPDICYWSKVKSQAFTDDQKLFPAPDWVVEVLSDSTAAKDRGVKYEDYEAHGVSEYWIVDPEQKIIEQYVLVNGRYDMRIKSDNGIIHGVALAGFAIPITAIFDEKENLTTLAKIMNP